MEGSSKDVDEVRRVKKRYVYLNSKSPVPARTKRYWKNKQRKLRNDDFPSSTYPPLSDKKKKESSSTDDAEDNGKIETTNEIFDVAPTNDEPGIEVMRNVEEVIEVMNAPLADELPRCSEPDISIHESSTEEALDPEEKYSMDFLIKTLMVLSTKLRHNLTYEAAQDIVKLLCVMSDKPITQGTKYYWKKVINDFSKWMTEHFICEKCGSYAGIKSSHLLHCSTCDDVVDFLRFGNVFIYISLTSQLREIFELTNIHETLQNARLKQCDAAIEDIYDGKLYKKGFVEDMISINFSFDGVPVFSSSNSSMYPVLCTINELTPKLRKNHILLCSLWFGRGKPTANEFLKPFVAEAQTLYHEGFEYEYKGTRYNKKCRVLAGISDTVARPTLRNSTQFNGLYGCGLCLHPGETVDKGRGIARVYPIDSEGNAFGEGLRTHDETLEHARRKEKGMKGLSVLCDIPGFNIVSSLDLDWMHAAPLGIARQFSKLWLDTEYHDQEFYIGNRIKDIDEILKLYTPTTDISRTPREMSDRANWKAHEWVIFLWFYSLLILHAVLPTKFVNHWALLVDALQILCKTSIMKSEVSYAHRLLTDFISGVVSLYGKKHVSFNVHLLAHFAASVENLGPLWAHSAFVFEDFNQTLLNYVKSSNGVIVQICDTFRSRCVVDRLNFLCAPHLNNAQKNYLNSVMNKRVVPTPTFICKDTSMLGVSTFHDKLPRDEILAFIRANVAINDSTTIVSYERVMVVNSEIVHSKQYTRVKKRSNCYVRLLNDEIFEIQTFYVLKQDDDATCYALGKYFEKKNKPFIKNRRLSNLIVLNQRTENLAVIDITMIKEKVVMLYVEHLEMWVACIHPNKFELLT